MKTKLLFTLFLVCLLPACSNMNSHSGDVDLTVQHESLSRHFEDEANEMQIKVDEHKKRLSQFKSTSYVYGRHAEDLKTHNQEVINLYEQIVVANRRMAQMFRDVGY